MILVLEDRNYVIKHEAPQTISPTMIPSQENVLPQVVVVERGAADTPQAKMTPARGGSKYSANPSAALYKDMIFPQRLMKMVSEPEHQDAITWLPDGKSFVILDRNKFESEVMPQFFPHKSKFASFVRKLNRWGFARVQDGPISGAYHHEFFSRDQPDLVARIFYQNNRTGVKIKEAASRSNQASHHQPTPAARDSFASLGSLANLKGVAANNTGSLLSLSGLFSTNSLASLGSLSTASSGGTHNGTQTPFMFGRNAMWDRPLLQQHSPNPSHGAWESPQMVRPLCASDVSTATPKLDPDGVQRMLLSACGVEPLVRKQRVLSTPVNQHSNIVGPRLSSPGSCWDRFTASYLSSYPMPTLASRSLRPRMEVSVFDQPAMAEILNQLRNSNKNLGS